MASNYPGSLDSFTTKTNKVDLTDADHINELQNSVVAIQTELGADPAGSQTNVVTRLAKILADSGAIRQGTSFPGTTEAGLIFYRTDEDKLYVRNAADSAWNEVGAIEDYEAGSHVDASAGATATFSVSGYTKVKELTKLFRGGIVNISWVTKSSDANQIKRVQLYRDGSATGEIQSVNSVAATTHEVCDFSVTGGQALQLYGHVPSTETGVGLVYDFKVKIGNPVEPVSAAI